jgi:putative spermidine/putrescine transport system substrate-binding protein
MPVESGRRDFLTAGAAACGLVLLGSPFGNARAQAAGVSGITWGGPWVKALTAEGAKQTAVNVNWSLHAGGAATVIAKLKATMPQHDLDIVHAFPPVFYSMMREGWLDPVSPEEVPNLRSIPAEMPVKDASGSAVDVPVSSSGQFWLYDEAALGMKIQKADDLLNPRLRGKLLAYAPTFQAGSFIVCLARARGGDERNIDPGFEFAKELAKAKIIGRVAKSDVEIINAYTTREVGIGMINLGSYGEVRKRRSMTLLNKVPGSPIFKTYISHEGFAILKGAKSKKAILTFLNYLTDPAVNAEYAPMVGQLPVNEKSAVPADLADIRLKDADERRNFGAYFDFQTMSQNLDAWNRRWELEVAPLLQS